MDREGKELYTIRNGQMFNAAYRLPNNGSIVSLQNNQCVLMDTTGKVVSSFNCNYGRMQMAGLDVLSNGHILVTQMRQGKVVEYDSSGKSVVEVTAPGAAYRYGPAQRTLSRNQPDQSAHRTRSDRAGKIVWEVKASSPILRARRAKRSAGPTAAPLARIRRDCLYD